jgi:hypothetical protein
LPTSSTRRSGKGARDQQAMLSAQVYVFLKSMK